MKNVTADEAFMIYLIQNTDTKKKLIQNVQIMAPFIKGSLPQKLNFLE